jgi:HEAT repeat protein
MNHDALEIALDDNDEQTRLAAIAQASENPAELNATALEALIRCLGASRKIIQRRAAEALAAAAPTHPHIVDNIRSALSHPDSRMRWGAAYALGLIDDALDLRATGALLEALASSDGDIRWAAAELVVRLGRDHRETVGNRLLALSREGNLNARKMALYCLRDVGGNPEELLVAAGQCCAENHGLLKMAALSLISHLGNAGERAAELALGLLTSDPDEGVRRCAAVALGHIGNRSLRVIEALQSAATNNGDIYMTRAASAALVRLGVRQ